MLNTFKWICIDCIDAGSTNVIILAQGRQTLKLLFRYSENKNWNLLRNSSNMSLSFLSNFASKAGRKDGRLQHGDVCASMDRRKQHLKKVRQQHNDRLLQSLDQQGMPLLLVPVKPYTSWHCDRENRRSASSRLLLYTLASLKVTTSSDLISRYQNIVLPFCHSLNNNGLCQFNIFQTPRFNETEVVQYCHSLFLSRNSKGKGINKII
jgi:hypothetical protein